jgi:hypothetical protein
MGFLSTDRAVLQWRINQLSIRGPMLLPVLILY